MSISHIWDPKAGLFLVHAKTLSLHEFPWPLVIGKQLIFQRSHFLWMFLRLSINRQRHEIPSNKKSRPIGIMF